MPDWMSYIASVGGVFSPRQLPGLIAWYDAADASTITIATGVSQWNDKSASGFNVVQANTANQPSVQSASQNGRDTILFDGTNDYLDGGDVLDFERTNAFTMIYVFSMTGTSPTTARTVFSKGDITSPFPGWDIRVSGTVANDPNSFFFINNFGGNNYLAFDWPRVNNTLFQKNVIVNSGTSAVAGFTVYTGGTEQTKTVNGLDALTSTTLTAISFNIGSIDDGGGVSRHFPGSMAELIIYNRVLNSTELASINTYILDKWGI